MKTYDRIKDLLEKLPHRLQVRFAYNCCLDIKDMPKEGRECLRLVKLWLKDKSLVTNDELCEAAYAATHAADTAYTAYTVYAANAAYAVAHAAYAATHAADTAYAAVNAANAATNAAYAAVNAAANTCSDAISHDKAMIKYHNDLILMIKDLTEVEKLIYNLESIDLDSMNF